MPNLTPRQQHVKKLRDMQEELKATTSYFRRNDLRKGIRQVVKDLKAYDRYTNCDGRTR